MAVVLTFNRRDRLAGVLEAIGAQTRPVQHVVVVDNASEDGTFEHLEHLLLDGGQEMTALRLGRNGGSAEGYHVALDWCIRRGFDWAWLVEDDLVPRPDALEQLLGTPQAGEPGTVALASAIDAPDGGELLVPRGTLKPRIAGTPCHAIARDRYHEAQIRIEYFGFLGSLLRLSAVQSAGLPRRELLGWIDDVEFSSRLARTGAAWLVPASRVLHDDGLPAGDFGAGFWPRLRRLRQEPSLPSMWRNAYGLRNLVWWGRRAGLVRRRHAIAYGVLLATRALLFAPDHRTLRIRIYARAAIDGWKGRLRSASPSDWPAIRRWDGSVASFLDAHAMDYDSLPVTKLVETTVTSATQAP